MVKRIIHFTAKDIVNAMRDNMVIFILLFPIIGAGALALLLPGIESGNLTFILNRDTPMEIRTPLEKYVRIELAAGDKKVQERVNQTDDAIGLIYDGKIYTLLLEGNEQGDAKELAETILIELLAAKPLADISFRSLGKTKSYTREYTAILLLISCLLMAGTMAAMNMVDEKEFALLDAIKISPLTLFDYLISRCLSIFGIALILAVIEVIILFGFHGIYLLQTLLVTLFSVLLGMLSAFIIGGFADNKIGAIGIMKGFFFIFTGIPIGAIFAAESWHWVFYLFPNYWLFNSFRNVFIDNLPAGVPGLWTSNLVMFIQSLVYLGFLLFIARKKFGLRYA